MSTHPFSPPRSTDRRPIPTVTPARLAVSEWIKLRTLRSAGLTILGAIAAMVVTGAVIGATAANATRPDPESLVTSGPLQGYYLAELIVGVLGAVIVTSEYTSGMIRGTFTAAPRRAGVLAAKAAVFGGLLLAAMTASSFAAFFAAQAFLGDEGPALSDPGGLRIVAGTGLYLALVGVLGTALGWIIRSTAGAVSAFVGLLWIVPTLLQAIPGATSETVAKVLPARAGEALISVAGDGGTLSPAAGAAVLAAWVLLALLAAGVLVARRDV